MDACLYQILIFQDSKNLDIKSLCLKVHVFILINQIKTLIDLFNIK